MKTIQRKISAKLDFKVAVIKPRLYLYLKDFQKESKGVELNMVNIDEFQELFKQAVTEDQRYLEEFIKKDIGCFR